jgi:hypothetical protein
VLEAGAAAVEVSIARLAEVAAPTSSAAWNSASSAGVAPTTRDSR